ncbi:hypothetical protein [Sunxiuqinia sp. sy24]|uniref:hypothetical protein n=1 Tax=Sunxiuqinia sp. sy24 TaxID=3461495 RepID=UPI004045D91B
MESIFNLWKTRVPQYNPEFQPLLEYLGRKGGGSENDKEQQGKTFSNLYEVYIYAFFLGLYNGERVEIDKGVEKKNFGQPIEYWGKTKAIGRKDFSDIQEYLFAAVVAKSDIDLVKLENANSSKVESAVRKLIREMEAFANAGFIFLQDLYDNNRNFLYFKENFVSLILPEIQEDEEEKKVEPDSVVAPMEDVDNLNKSAHDSRN